jgi:hypothetical protein
VLSQVIKRYWVMVVQFEGLLEELEVLLVVLLAMEEHS